MIRPWHPFFWALTLAVSSGILAAADEPKPGKSEIQQKPLVIDDTSNVGRELRLRLKGERAMTGWGGLVLTPGKELLTLKDRGFEAAAKATDSAIGTYVYRLNPRKAGTCEIFCRYIFPDGNGYESQPRTAVQVVREFRMTVKIVDAEP